MIPMYQWERAPVLRVECVQACPTGALMPKSLIGSQVVDKKIDSVCQFAGWMFAHLQG